MSLVLLWVQQIDLRMLHCCCLCPFIYSTAVLLSLLCCLKIYGLQTAVAALSAVGWLVQHSSDMLFKRPNTHKMDYCCCVRSLF